MPASQSWMNIKKQPAGFPFDLSLLPNNKKQAAMPALPPQNLQPMVQMENAGSKSKVKTIYPSAVFTSWNYDEKTEYIQLYVHTVCIVCVFHQ